MPSSCETDEEIGMSLVEGGFSNLSSCIVRVLSCLSAFRNAGLSIDQLGGQMAVVSIPNEFDLVLLPSGATDVLASCGGRSEWVVM